MKYFTYYKYRLAILNMYLYLYIFLIDQGFYPLLVMVYKCFNIYLILYRVFTGSGTVWRDMVILEYFEVQNCTDTLDV